MIGSKFGFSGQNQPYSVNSSIDTINRRIGNLSNKLIPARVTDVILDESHPDFLNLGEWNSIGTIKYELINFLQEEPANVKIAKPLLANTKTFPL
jgi:hypothetical protein